MPLVNKNFYQVIQKVLMKKISSLGGFDQRNLVFWLLITLLIFGNSADFDGWIKLIKRKEKYITFFDIPEINLKI